MVNALFQRMLAWEARGVGCFCKEMAIQGGYVQQIPPQAMDIILGFSCSSYVPTSHTGKGIPNVFAPMDFFKGHSPLNIVVIAQKNHAVRQTFF